MKIFENKICYVCSRPWEPKTYEQNARNKTCSKECRAAYFSANRKNTFDETVWALAVCKLCKNEKVKIIRTIYKDRRKEFVDRSGKIWWGRICPDCRPEEVTKYNRKTGKHKSRSDVLEKTTRKGFLSELIAKKYFEDIGFLVQQCNVHGPDLILDKSINVEVKSVIFTKNSCYVAAVKKLRKNDDLIAFVLPNGKVLVQDMISHLKMCPPSGIRSLTNIVRPLCLY